jgi:two-component system, OmpR family, response regulator RegX3
LRRTTREKPGATTPGPRTTGREKVALAEAERIGIESLDVLLVEDDDAIADVLVRGLEREGYHVSRVANGTDAVHAPEPDLVLLDLGLPDVDGFELCQDLVARSDAPVIILTARSEEGDRVMGLQLGADDYVVKPFGFRELVARMQAVSRRRQPRKMVAPTMRVGGLEIDRRSRHVILDGRSVDLTRKEFDVLALLAEDPGAAFPRQQIMERVWGHPWFGPTKTLDVHVASIRRKLGDAGWIETVRGVGFTLRPRG